MPPDPNCCTLAASCLMIRPTEQNPTPHQIMHPWPPGFGRSGFKVFQIIRFSGGCKQFVSSVSYPRLTTAAAAGLTCCRNLNPSSNQQSDMGASAYHSKRPRSFARNLCDPEPDEVVSLSAGGAGCPTHGELDVACCHLTCRSLLSLRWVSGMRCRAACHLVYSTIIHHG